MQDARTMQPATASSNDLRVYKFGGTSVGSAEAIRLAIARVKEAAPSVVAVVSAMGGVTDLLLAATAHAVAGRTSEASESAERFGRLYMDLVTQLITSRKATLQLEEHIEQSTHELLAMCESIAILQELTPRSRDAVVARGERMMAEIFTAALREHDVDAVMVDAADIIITERRMGSLWPKLDACERRGERLIVPLLAARKIVVLPGFIGRGPEGEVVTLGRGGSDFSAAIIARVVNAASLTLWKEVDGLMTADPKMVPDARVLPELHYREAGELAYYGAKVLHPRTMIPLVDRGIPLLVRNSFNPSFSGTRVASDVTAGAYPVKALTAVHGQALISIEGSGMLGVPGIAARTFTALSQAGHSVSMISQSSSEASICFVLPEEEAADAVRALNEAFALEISTRLVDTVRAESDIALLAVVGLGMRGTPGIAARAFAALSHAHVNVIAIAQGSSELNITVTIRQSDVARALPALHQEFQLDKLRPLLHRDRGESSMALLGFGQIGRALVRQIVSQETYFRHDLGVKLHPVAIADRSGFRIAEDGFSAEELTTLMERKESGVPVAMERAADHVASIDFLRAQMRSHVWSLPSSRMIVVDVTADETAPLLMEALRRRCHVVVANKKPLAVPQSEFDAMIAAAREQGVSLRYEATVGAGLPVLDTLAKLKEAGDQIETILGCLSGTLGYLMTQLEDGIAFSAAVKQAHALGYTEPDPRDDLSGVDVGRKALILARTLGRKLDLSDIAIESLFPPELGDADASRFMSNLERIDAEVSARVAKAREQGNVLRYVARIGDTIRVGLEEVPASSPVGRLRGTDNQIVLQTRRYRTNPLIVTGPGAGAEVTAAGVLNDILAISMR
jgi:aspartokinase/homoserine dehydrogenase 1